ncbi:MarR family winged helix-turn-helix transcriptional regulator [Kribbella solani]|uniref:MarR family winged helix-turn-helix transcriptional regulator n=1 Tax=Kribbella solani TaxID=236067 RepID=UPI0029A173FD|nr:MarR family transcriptional regulator [Kribbella solani]MDX2971860.1 MarR family transcriptional regulator [Kribbella solani]
MQLVRDGLEVGRDAAAQELLEGVSSLVRAARCIEHRQLAGVGGLRRSDASVLKVLMKDGEQRGGEIAAKLGVDASVVSRQVTALEADGLVSRRPDPADARVGLVSLAPRGKAQLEALYASYTQQLRAALVDLDDDAMVAAAATMQRVAHAIVEANQLVRQNPQRAFEGAEPTAGHSARHLAAREERPR